MRLTLLCTLLLVACAHPGQEITHPQVEAHDSYLTALTSGSIGCPPAEIAISAYQTVVRTWGGAFESETATWTAACRGKTFHCSGAHTTQCREALPPIGP